MSIENLLLKIKNAEAVEMLQQQYNDLVNEASEE